MPKILLLKIQFKKKKTGKQGRDGSFKVIIDKFMFKKINKQKKKQKKINPETLVEFGSKIPFKLYGFVSL